MKKKNSARWLWVFFSPTAKPNKIWIQTFKNFVMTFLANYATNFYHDVIVYFKDMIKNVSWLNPITLSCKRLLFFMPFILLLPNSLFQDSSRAHQIKNVSWLNPITLSCKRLLFFMPFILLLPNSFFQDLSRAHQIKSLL